MYVASGLCCSLWFLFQAPFGLSLASLCDEMICFRRALGEEPRAGLSTSNSKETMIEREAWEMCHQSYLRQDTLQESRLTEIVVMTTDYYCMEKLGSMV